ncbi:hypothetical protein [Thalassovita sp.]|uniref:hypothetical protein n=1 Tax=Thalassovita sp. TaxID=1979401 RepID=UPI0029DE60B6|nr:hypothetical protein [Thalassovita sp.]
MTLWTQTLDQVITAHPAYGLTAKGPAPAALGIIGGTALALRYDAPLIGALVALILILLPLIVTHLLERHRIRFELTGAAAIRHQGAFESSLPFGAEVNYTLTRGPIRRALNLPGVLQLHSQTGVMRSLSLKWPVAVTEMPALDAALKTALKGKRP